ncbi:MULTISPECIES: hypothetical protein [Bacillales]|uniref:hypothetical protein n=1 Tax=Bacillales TaxID=1385 RepID=UPI0003449E11|nr:MULTISPECIES: hypothetical protein [Bacillales]KMZ42507.1 hypothetical protein AC624_16020 [Bacillus sp. FJAT-27238]
MNRLGVTAVLGARNRISPELLNIVRASRVARRELGHLDQSTQDVADELRNVRRAAEQSEQAFRQEIQGMRREVERLETELRSLSSTRARPTITADNQAEREIARVRNEVRDLNGTKAEVILTAAVTGATAGAGMVGGIGLFDQIVASAEAEARRAVIGATKEEMARYRKQVTEMTALNKNVDRATVSDLLTDSERYSGKAGLNQASAYLMSQQALKLNAIRPDMGGVEEYQKTMFAMQNAWKDIKDTGRFGDTLARVAKNTTDIRGEALDSLIEYSVQVTKFLDTPEKLAALMEEMNGLWSIDKGFDALKETTLKLYNEGDLTNALKTAYESMGIESKEAQKQAEEEAKTVQKLISSGDIAKRQSAVGMLMQTFGSIKDEEVRQALLNEIGSGPGEDLGTKAFAELLRKAGGISQSQHDQYKLKGELDKSFQVYKDSNPLKGFQQAKNTLINEFIELGVVVGQDLAPAMEFLAAKVKWFKEKLDGMSSGGALATLSLVVGGVAAGLWGLKAAVLAAARALRDLALSQFSQDVGDAASGGGTGETGNRRNRHRRTIRREDLRRGAIRRAGGTVGESASDIASRAGAMGSRFSMLSKVMKKVPVIGALLGAVDVVTTAATEGNSKNLWGSIGGWLGGVGGGALAGAALGSVGAGPIGTFVGGIVGAIGGAIGGEAFGQWLFDAAEDGMGAITQYASGISTKIDGFLAPAKQEFDRFWGNMPDGFVASLGYIVGYGSEKFSQLRDMGWQKAGELAIAMGQKGIEIKDAFVGWVSTLPGSIKKWLDEAAKMFDQFIVDVQTWFSNLPNTIETGITSTFQDLASGFTLGKTTAKAKPYANGGVIDRPHLGLVGEAGPEAIIPLSSGRKNRAYELWKQVGARLGIDTNKWENRVAAVKGFIDDNNDPIGYAAGVVEGTSNSFKKMIKQRWNNYHASMSSATSINDAMRLRADAHRTRNLDFKFGKVMKVIGKAVKPIGYAMDVWDIANADNKQERNRTIMKVIGGMGGGALGGVIAGAALGSLAAPGAGTMAGGALGGLAGTVGGEWLATSLYDKYQEPIDGAIDNIGSMIGNGYANTRNWLGNKVQSAKDNILGVGAGLSNLFGWGKKYANGGMINKPHLGLVGEAGPEVIIPLSAGRRKRALELLGHTTRKLGVTPYANGGMVGPLRSSFGSNQAKVVQVKVDAPIQLHLHISGDINQEKFIALLKSPAVMNQLSQSVEKLIVDAVETNGGAA